MNRAAFPTIVVFALAAAPLRAADSPVEFFEAKVRPLLIERCQKCHGEAKQSGGLRLDNRDAIAKGGDNGAVIDLKKPDGSRLLAAIRHTGELKMPPEKKLSDDEIAVLGAWVKLGAPFPAATTFKPAPAKTHWAFQPVKPTTIPAAKATVHNPIDAFVAARLEAKGLSMSPAADRAVWLRRVTFDLHGLPPTPQEIDNFLADASDDEAAFARVVDRLLSNVRYGERWGRHWLDVARYADSKGYVFTEERRYPYAYTYRDYVVRAFNEDLAYDRFIVEQLAADRLQLDDPKPLAAMGFLTLGRRFLNNQHDIIDDRIDVVTRGFLGLTVTCARCHDHKYDPIPTADYYSLYGVFASCTEPLGPLIGKPELSAAYEEFEKQIAKLEGDVRAFREQCRENLIVTLRVTSQLGGVSFAGLGPTPVKDFMPDRIEKLMNRADREKLRGLKNKVESFRATSPDAPPRAMVLNDDTKPTKPHILVRGNPGNRGAEVPRQFLGVLAPDRKPFTDGSGRLELAKAIADPKNPLTARVLVNRVWAHHFGRGLVTTPSDFGLRSDPPSHPELLDWLADRFVADGWSIKKLHRRIVLSGAYRQSASTAKPPAADPENRLLSSFPRQRLDLEALRDSLLFVSGKLDTTVGGPAVDIFREPFVPRRTIYGFIDRQNLQSMFTTFDFASPDTHVPQRFATTVPQQALFLMNGSFVVQQAKAVIARPDVAGASGPEERIALLYRVLFGRSPTSDEIDLGVKFVSDESVGPPRPESKLSPWERYAQVLLLSNEFAFVD